MSTFFNSVHISNFKSLKDVTLSDCRRINLLIGKPNVGKSNILEAIGLFSVGHIRLNKNRQLSQFVRFENIPELFYDGQIDKVISIILTNDNNLSEEDNCYQTCTVQYIDSDTNNLSFSDFDDNQLAIQFSEKSRTLLEKANPIFVDNKNDIQKIHNLSLLFDIKQYKFLTGITLEKKYAPYLLPPFGVNLLSIIQEQKALRAELSKIISEYGWKLNIDNSNHSLRILKELGEDTVFTLPYSSIADTLQRLIFFKAAIASNKNSILLFEEPEAHCFPPYITHIAKEIIDSESNQFFIATHSPYILDTFLEKNRTDLAIFMADFKDGQTVIKRLTDDELNEVYEYGLDLFFNSELFTDEI